MSINAVGAGALAGGVGSIVAGSFALGLADEANEPFASIRRSGAELSISSGSVAPGARYDEEITGRSADGTSIDVRMTPTGDRGPKLPVVEARITGLDPKVSADIDRVHIATDYPSGEPYVSELSSAVSIEQRRSTRTKAIVTGGAASLTGAALLTAGAFTKGGVRDFVIGAGGAMFVVPLAIGVFAALSGALAPLKDAAGSVIENGPGWGPDD